jgi:hypothetical protein
MTLVSYTVSPEQFALVQLSSVAHGQGHIPRQTTQDLMSFAGRAPNKSFVSRNQGVVDQRTKEMEAKLRLKYHNRRIDAIVAHMDVQMQKLLGTQDPAKGELYDKFAERREMYLSKRF